MCICKACILDLYAYYLENTRDKMIAMYEVCKRLDTYFDKNLFESADIQCQSTGSNICKIYYQKVNSLKQLQGLTFYDVADKDNIVQKIKSLEENISSEIKNSSFDLTDDIIEFWGRGF